jgi:hypothetical protein
MVSSKHLLVACLAAGVWLSGPQVGHAQAPPALVEPDSLFGPMGPHWVCWEGELPPERLAEIGAAMEELHLRYNLHGTRWGGGGQGDPVTVLWSFVPDGTDLPQSSFDMAPCTIGVQDSTLFATMDAQFAGIGGRAAWIQVFQDSFDRWEELTGINFVRVTNGGNDWDDGAEPFGNGGAAGAAGLRGDIRIGAKCIDGVPAGGSILAYNGFPGSGGDMVLDDQQTWTNAANNFQFMRNTILHELGHGIGLRHVCPVNQTKLMEPTITVNFDGPQHDDIRGSHDLYGDPFEKSGGDDTTGTGNNLGQLTYLLPRSIGGAVDFPAPAVNNGSIHSLDGTGDLDVFLFTTTRAEVLDTFTTPIGLTYDNSTQNSDGTCNSGNNIDSRNIQDLSLAVFGPAPGFPLILASDAAGVGQGEIILSLGLPDAGTYAIVVASATATTGSQLYSLDLLVQNDPPVCDPGGPYGPLECVAGQAQVMLDGSGAFDPDDDPITFEYFSSCGSIFDDNTLESPTATIPFDGDDCPLVCEVQQNVDDGLRDSNCFTTITVQDTIDPVWAPAPMSDTFECDPAQNQAQINAWVNSNAGAAATDTCDLTPSVGRFNVLTTPECGFTSTITMQVRATDGCNEISEDVMFEVVDTTPPTITCPVDPIIATCTSPNGIDAADVFIDVMASDTCGGVVITDDAPDVYPPSCGDLYPATTVTFTATDDCGNQATCEAIVEVKGARCCPGLVDSELTLMSPDLNFTVGGAPVTTKAKFDIWNQNEIRFSGHQKCVTCWDQTFLSAYPMPNHFLASNIQTDIGRARIDGVAEPQCPGAVATPLLGVITREITFAGCPLPSLRSSRPLTGRGTQDAMIQYSPVDLRSGDDDLRVGPPENIAQATKNGALLVFVKVEVKWDFAGNIVRDTFLELTNDGEVPVGFQLYFVNGEQPADAVVDLGGAIIERAHQGWNFTDQQIVLTQNEPTYWSAHTGLPKGITPFSNLDGGPPLGRPDPDPRNPGGRMVRGFVVGWAVNAEGLEIKYNRLAGRAMMVDYAQGTADEYESWSFRCVAPVADLAQPDATPGRLLLDGLEYDAAPEKLLTDFFTPGSPALSQRDALERLNSPFTR